MSPRTPGAQLPEHPDWLAPGGAPVELFHRVNQQDFDACERTQPGMSSRAYTKGGALVPSEHHISEFHTWLQNRLSSSPAH